MADFDRIKDVTLTYADLYAREFARLAPVDTGRLRNSYRASTSERDGKFVMQIFGEYYGPFQSFGVGPGAPAIAVPLGVNPPPRSGDTYKFRNPNRGIKPQPFMQTAITNITPKFTKALEEAGAKDIEDFFDSLSMIEVQ